MNAILRKELRTLLRERRGFIVPVSHGLLLIGCAAMFMAPDRGTWDPWRVGQELTVLIAVFQGLAMLVVAPLLGAAGIAGERERGTLARLLASPIRRRHIVTGKALASMVYLLVLSSISLPVAAAAYVLCGADLETIFGIYVSNVLLGACLVSLGLLVSSAFERTWTSALFSLALPAGAILLNVAVWSAAQPADPLTLPSAVARWAPVFNLGYGFVLFVGEGPFPMPGVWPWLVHYAFLIGLGAIALLLLDRRMASIRD